MATTSAGSSGVYLLTQNLAPTDSSLRRAQEREGEEREHKEDGMASASSTFLSQYPPAGRSEDEDDPAATAGSTGSGSTGARGSGSRNALPRGAPSVGSAAGGGGKGLLLVDNAAFGMTATRGREGTVVQSTKPLHGRGPGAGAVQVAQPPVQPVTHPWRASIERSFASTASFATLAEGMAVGRAAAVQVGICPRNCSTRPPFRTPTSLLHAASLWLVSRAPHRPSLIVPLLACRPPVSHLWRRLRRVMRAGRSPCPPSHLPPPPPPALTRPQRG